MLALPGRLERSTLGDIFGELHRQAADGALRLIESLPHLAREHAVQFRSGLIHAVFSPVSAAAVENLTRGETTERLRERQVAVRLQHLARLEQLFDVKKAALRFRAVGALGNPGLSVPLHPSDFLHGRPRLRDTLGHRGFAGAPRADIPAVGPSQQRLDLAILGLAEIPTKSGLRSAFRKRALRWHPDTNPTQPPWAQSKSEQTFAALSAAYHRLLSEL